MLQNVVGRSGTCPLPPLVFSYCADGLEARAGPCGAFSSSGDFILLRHEVPDVGSLRQSPFPKSLSESEEDFEEVFQKQVPDLYNALNSAFIYLSLTKLCNKSIVSVKCIWFFSYRDTVFYAQTFWFV